MQVSLNSVNKTVGFGSTNVVNTLKGNSKLENPDHAIADMLLSNAAIGAITNNEYEQAGVYLKVADDKENTHNTRKIGEALKAAALALPRK